MRVRVVRLRAGGEKLPREEVLAAEGTLGHLVISPRDAALYARPEGPITNLPYLFDPQVRHLRGDEFVITGWETVPGGRLGDRWTQAWWCRLTQK